MLALEGEGDARQLHLADVGWKADAQTTARALARGKQVLVHFFHFDEPALALLVVERSRFGDAQAPRVALHQARPERRFQSREAFTDGGLGGAEIARSLGKAARFVNAREKSHQLDAVHH